MARGSRPVGRQKRVGSGGGGVFRRGEGLGGSAGGPIGDAGGYSDRTGEPPSGQAGDSGRGFGGLPSGGGGLPGGGSTVPGGGCLKITIVLVVIGIALYFLSSLFGGGVGDPGGTGSSDTSGSSSGFESAAAAAATTYVDQGAYPVAMTVSNAARDKRTLLRGNGDDTVTIMVYLCATDLEAQGGMATADLNEMLHAEISEKVNVIVETGGTQQWQNSVISSRTNQRYRLTNKGLVPLEKDLGRQSMVDPATLADFIRYSRSKYPADRYMLVMWDHGGGSVTGYGYDQNFPNDGMTIDEIQTALKGGGCTFDMIGFDACLMATLETAIVLEPYADYMVASEETEPGSGWYYTNWITALSRNTSIPTTDLGKVLIDDYVKEVKAKTPGSQATLSLIDLAELKGTVPPSLATFAKSTTALIDAKDYQAVADARAGAKEFAPSARLNQIDLIHFAENIGTDESKALAEALRGCVKYNRTSTNITNANGVSIFFPYGGLSQMGSMLQTYDEIGMGVEYAECVRSFASVTAGGQVVSSGSGNMLETLLGGLSGGSQAPSSGGTAGAEAMSALLNAFLSSGDYNSITGSTSGGADWLDANRMKSAVDSYADKQLDASALVISEKGGRRVLELPRSQWDLVQYMEMNVFVDDGEGFIDLGLDNVYEYNNAGDLVMEYDGTWLALNGHIVGYYVMSDDHHGDRYSIKGRVPAKLNGQLVDIILVFDSQNPYGVVLGAQKRYDVETETGTVPKGLIGIVAGDTIDYLCDYYTYDGRYSDTYLLGEQYTATGEWQIENLSVGKSGYQMTYRITDIYGNKYWTPSVTD